MRLVWDQLYNVAIKNIVDAIANSENLPSVNAALRIHRVYLMSVLTDIYGDLPCQQAGLGYISGIATPEYETQEDIYNFFFDELTACAEQLGKNTGRIGGDVTSLNGSAAAWRKYANSLRMRFAMRISDINPTKAQEEFEKALKDDGGYIASAADDAYIIYTDGPFTLYDGSRDLDFRVNALGEILYGQDAQSPTMICSTFFNIMKDNADPRLYRICRHYLNTKRADVKPDREWNVDVTDEVRAYLATQTNPLTACNPGEAWYDDWVNAPANSEIPTLERLVNEYPDAGFDKNNYNARMMRPMLNIDFEMPDRPGTLINYAEVEFLLAEASLKRWNVNGTPEEHFKAGIRAAMHWLNDHYLNEPLKIADAEIDAYINHIMATNPLKTAVKACEAINTQAWILHMMNPSEAWANLRRSDYPVILDRTKLPTWKWAVDDINHLETPTRLRYPTLEGDYNKANYDEAVKRFGTVNDKGEYVDDWHHRLWWDTDDIHVK